MNKILHVAVREFLATVATKGFIIGIVIMPLMILVMIVGMQTAVQRGGAARRGRGGGDRPHRRGLRRLARLPAARRRSPSGATTSRSWSRSCTPEALKAVPGAPRPADAPRRRRSTAMLGEVPDARRRRADRTTDLEAGQGTAARRRRQASGGRLALVVVHDDAVRQGRRGPGAVRQLRPVRPREARRPHRRRDPRRACATPSSMPASGSAGLDRELHRRPDQRRPRSARRRSPRRARRRPTRSSTCCCPRAFMVLLLRLGDDQRPVR